MTSYNRTDEQVQLADFNVTSTSNTARTKWKLAAILLVFSLLIGLSLFTWHISAKQYIKPNRPENDYPTATLTSDKLATPIVTSIYDQLQTVIDYVNSSSMQTSETTTPYQEPDYNQTSNKVMVVGGYDTSSEVEVVNISGEEQPCQIIPDYPFVKYGSIGTYIGGKAIVCGGKFDSTTHPTPSCYHYNTSSNRWVESHRMNQARYLASGVQLSETEWWVAGGHDGTKYVNSTEILSTNKGFSTYVTLPMMPDGMLSLTKINVTHFMLNVNRNAWIFDRAKGEFYAIPNRRKYGGDVSAGLVRYPDGRRSVVVLSEMIGMGEIFDLDSQTWATGRFQIPSTFECIVLPWEDTFLLVVGCPQYRSCRGEIYRFDPAVDDIVKIPRRLRVHRSFMFTAFLVPDDFVKCE